MPRRFGSEEEEEEVEEGGGVGRSIIRGVIKSDSGGLNSASLRFAAEMHATLSARQPNVRSSKADLKYYHCR